MLRRLLIIAVAILGAATPAMAAPLQLHVERATIAPDPLSGFVQFQVQLKPDSATALKKFTARHVGQVVQMWVDGELVMSPMIQTVITGGAITISGDFSTGELDRMADQLNADTATIEVIAP